MDWTQAAYHYDGSFAGFLCCVFEAYLHKEAPACFLGPEDGRFSLWPEREVITDQAHARRVYQSLDRKIGAQGRRLVTYGFLTCLPEKEMALWAFLRLGYEQGPQVVRALTDDRVNTVTKAVQHLTSEAHLLKGFTRFSEQDGVLIGEIEPKNRVLPLLRTHFCTRYSRESFVLYDRTHKEALFYQPGHWAILPLADFQVNGPNQEELDYRKLWRRFYNTISIEGRYNPKCRMTHMPKRYWNIMTEFQREAEGGTASPALNRP